MFKMFKPIYQDVVKEVKRVQPRRIIIGGHSLGGAQALMHGYHIQQVVGPEVHVCVCIHKKKVCEETV
jgi:hypothetical protein